MYLSGYIIKLELLNRFVHLKNSVECNGGLMLTKQDLLQVAHGSEHEVEELFSLNKQQKINHLCSSDSQFLEEHL